MNTPYADAADLYRATGWQGVLPVGHRPRMKKAPPEGYTGDQGAWPTAEDIATWRVRFANVNVALRLPAGVIGIDVDDYDGKPGADTMAAGVAAHGSPPRTWRSTSREGASGIRLYRVPPGTKKFPGALHHPERRDDSGVEIIQFGHRYAIVEPSVHPEGRQYRWFGPDGKLGPIPSPEELPELPAAWRDHLAETCACFASTPIRVATSGDPVADRLAEAKAALAGAGSRHEAVLKPALALVYYRNRGAPGAAEALEILHLEFVAAVTTPGLGDTRKPHEAEAEWHRMTAEGKAATAGKGEPPWDSRQSGAATSPDGHGGTSRELEARAWPEPEDRGTAVLSALGHLEYVEDLLRPGRIVVWAAEEGAGKSYTVAGECGIRVAVAGGSLAGTWKVLVNGGVLVLSEMHSDDDYVREDEITGALNIDRASLAGRYYRLSLMTAAGGPPALTVAKWRTWVTEWMREHKVLLLIVDTATGATEVDPWGKAIQGVYRDLRAMLEDYPELAIVLVLHLKKPTGRGARRISDVLGEWGRWCDVVVLQEADGTTRTKLATHKRVRHQRRIVATRRDGLLVDPVDVAEAKGSKVSPDAVLAAIVGKPGMTFKELGAALEVTPKTASRYVTQLGTAVRTVAGTARSGPGAAVRVYPVETSGQIETGTGVPTGVETPEASSAGVGTSGHPPYKGVQCPDPTDAKGPGMQLDAAEMWAAIDRRGGVDG